MVIVEINDFCSVVYIFNFILILVLCIAWLYNYKSYHAGAYLLCCAVILSL